MRTDLRLSVFSHLTADATTQFMTTYRRDAAVAVRRRAGEVTATNGDDERTQRRLREAETDDMTPNLDRPQVQQPFVSLANRSARYQPAVISDVILTERSAGLPVGNPR